MSGTGDAGTGPDEVIARLSGELVLVLDHHGRVVALSGSRRPELAWLREIAGSRHWRAVLHPDDRADVVRGVALLLDGGDIDRLAFRVRLTDGRVRVVEGRAAGDPTTGGAVVVLRDATAEQRRVTIEDRLAGLGRIGTWEVDLSDGTTRWSPQLRELFGLAPEDDPLDVESILQCYQPPHRQQFAEAIERLLNDGEPFELELALHPRRGQDRWVRASAQALHLDGQAGMILGTVQDLTDSYHEQRRLARVEQLARLTDNGLLELDAAHLLRFMNPRARELLGVPEDVPIEGQDLAAVLMDGVDPGPLQRLLETADAGLTRDRLPVGTSRWLKVALRRADPAALDGADGPGVSAGVRPPEPTVLMALSDITDLVQAEQARDAFLAMVSHELRSPLVAVRGALETLDRGIAGPLPDPAVLLLEVAARSAGRLERLVEDLLDSQRILAGRFPLHVAEHDLSTIADEVLQDLEYVAVRSGRTLERRGPSLPSPVRADADRLQQVISNLIGNALRYAPVSTAVEVEVSSSGPGHRVVVRDRGPGVPEAFRERIFDRFAQADPADARSVGGAGLGLAISRELIERMGGRIGFDSEPGWTEFWFELPASGRPSGDGDGRGRRGP